MCDVGSRPASQVQLSHPRKRFGGSKRKADRRSKEEAAERREPEVGLGLLDCRLSLRVTLTNHSAL
jgi:hypothetical protein